MKIVKNFQLDIVIFTPVKNRCKLHGRVFVMEGPKISLCDSAVVLRLSFFLYKYM